MRSWFFAMLLAVASTASAHRLDEYLQLTALSVERGRVRATLYLTPGVAVAKRVIALMDANGDGVLSPTERRAYAARVARDLALSVDGTPLKARVVACRFPEIEALRQGLGTVEIDLQAVVSVGPGRHTLDVENRHQRPIAAYLVECLAPDPRVLQVASQRRSPEQARYRLEYVLAKA